MPKMPFGSWVGRWLIRRALAMMPAAKLGDVRLELVEAEGARLRLYHPPVKRSPGGMLWIHGGGYVIGTATLDDRLCAETARELGMIVASAEYRLAPEHPFPAPLEDCMAAWRWLRAHADDLGIDAERIAIGGQSAGAGLAAALVQQTCDLGESAAAQLLFCPMLDDRTAADHSLDRKGHRLWSNTDNRTGWRAYLGEEPGPSELPAYAAPARRVDLTGLPPAWIGVGDIDLFFTESAKYARRLYESAVPAKFHVVPAAPHGFEAWAFDTSIARNFRAAARLWLNNTLTPDL